MIPLVHDRPHRAVIERIRAIKLAVFDFDGVFTDNSVYVFEDGREAVRCSRYDGLGLRKLERAGVEPLIISTETNPVVQTRAAKLKVQCHSGCADKVLMLEQVMAERGLAYGQISFVGNDINDASCLERVGLPIVVRDAHPDVVPLALYQTRWSGGRGAVREVCDLFAEVLGSG